MTSTRKQQVSVMLPPATVRKVRRDAAHEGRGLGEVIRRIVDAHYAAPPPQRPPRRKR